MSTINDKFSKYYFDHRELTNYTIYMARLTNDHINEIIYKILKSDI